MSGPKSIPKVFICYARADNDSDAPRERWLDRVLNHLQPYQQQGLIEVVSDKAIGFGEDWDEYIQKNLAEARIAILLVSSSFLASKYIGNSELPVLLQRRHDVGLRIFPVLISASGFDKVWFNFPDPKTGKTQRRRLSSLQGAGSRSKTLYDLKYGEQERLLTDLAEAVVRHAESLGNALEVPPVPLPQGPRVDPASVPVPLETPRGEEPVTGQPSWNALPETDGKGAVLGKASTAGKWLAFRLQVGRIVVAIGVICFTVVLFVVSKNPGSGQRPVVAQPRGASQTDGNITPEGPLGAEGPPAITEVAEQTIQELEAWSFPLELQETTGAKREVTFALNSGPPGLTVTPAGVVSWTPTEAQGPSTNQVMIRVADAGSPQLAATNQFIVIVLESNESPELASPGLQRVMAGGVLSLQVTAKDEDEPANGLRFSKVRGPTGLTVGEDGRVTWKIAVDAEASTNSVVVKVSDDGKPPGSATTEFQVVVENAASKERVNSLGMKFVPVKGISAWFCVWETRYRDYEAYARENAAVDSSWRKPEFGGVNVTPGPEHPVVNVSWEDSVGFCRWLTQRERASGLLKPGEGYRLPTDLEWSAAVGLRNEVGATPKDRSEKGADEYPWGKPWPPPDWVGNYADETSKARRGPDSKIIPGYQDSHAGMAPVGTYPAQENGLFDLGGNVWEWCKDYYNGQDGNRVLRGGSWGNWVSHNLLSSYRSHDAPDARVSIIGFRVVLVGDGSAR